MINRRSLITGLISLTAAPAIVRASSLMPVKVIEFLKLHDSYWNGFIYTYFEDGRIIRKAISDFEFYKGMQWEK